MLADRELSFNDYLMILRRRRWWIVVPALVLPLVAYLVSLKIPDSFTSQTLILVEQQKVPTAYVRSVVTEEVTERLANMQGQILSRSRLQPLIERFGLYKDRTSVPMEVLVEEMRSNITISGVRADFANRTGGLPGFHIGFTADDPRVAQQVCAELTSMFLEENLKAREQRAQGTTDFLGKQLEEAKQNLDAQDAKLAEFKRQHVGGMPGQEQVNLSLMMSHTTRLDAATQAVNRAQQDKDYLESLLSQQLATRNADVGTNTPEALDRQLTGLQGQLVSLQARYTDDHPDVIKVKGDIAKVQQRLGEVSSAPKTESKITLQDPPDIRQLRAQIHQQEQIIRLKTAEQERARQAMGAAQSRLQGSPLVEEQFKAVTRDYHIALSFYNELLAKKTQSEMATDMERRQQGEQFRVIDPANLPGEPSFPNRPLFALGGLGIGLAFGFGMIVLLETKDHSLRNEQDVVNYLGLPTLAVMPTIAHANGNGRKPHFWNRIHLPVKARPADRPEA
ncbi:MAG: Wzz/FepE/Etk N-terminal domain-containing protein [Acidobacteria bacterium]|nr:Wzz/FepE/Etk N-terminal domain-containing protein [Acidobacteriota bacterium]